MELLSEREGLRDPEGPYDGVPHHLRAALINLVQRELPSRSPTAMQRLRLLAARLRIALSPGGSSDRHRSEFTNALLKDETLFLDALDLMVRPPIAEELRWTLTMGGSVWTVSEDGTSLARRVPDAEAAAYSAVTKPEDEASTELRTAWQAAYGRSPDPSDAWDHAIKAVEAVLVPIVVPTQERATLGHVRGELAANPGQWEVNLASDAKSDRLLALVEAIWANPDRHAGGSRREPTLPQAEGTIAAAVTVVSWARRRLIRRTSA